MKRLRNILPVALLCMLALSCRNTASDTDRRIERLLARMTLQEKVGQMAQLTIEPFVIADGAGGFTLDTALLREAGDLRAPHRVAHYLEDLAATYHKWYNVERVVPMALTDPEARGEDAEAVRIAKAPEPARAAARLKLNDAVRTVIAEGLDLLGVTAPDRM